MERLCFGTFINILARCRQKRVKKGQLVNEIVKTIDPDSKYYVPRDKSKSANQTADKDKARYRALNHLYKCTGDFSPIYSNVVKLALKVDREEVIQHFREDIILLIDQDKSAQLTLALYNLIKNDITLNADTGGNVSKFQNCAGGKALQSFLNDTQCDLPYVLASIFLYTVTAVENNEGKEWLEEISEKYRDVPRKYEAFFEEYVNKFRLVGSNTELTNDAKIEVEQEYNKSQARVAQSPWALEPVYIPDELIESFADYSVVDFINLNPMDLIDENYTSLWLSGKAPHGLSLIRNAMRFVRHIKRTMEQEEISIWDKSVREFVDIFVKTLEAYIDFLRNNSPYPDLNCSPFTLEPADIEEFERKAAEYRTNLQSLYDRISDMRRRGLGLPDF